MEDIKEFLRDTAVKILVNRVYFLLILMVLVAILMSTLSPRFLTLSNIASMTQIGAVLALLAMGESLIILAGGAGIDLSVGSIVSLSGVLFGLLVRNVGINVWAAIPLCVLAGALMGMVNGVTVALWGIPPLIGTLGTMWTYGALALVITGGVPISGYPDAFSFIGQGTILGVPAQIFLIVLPVFFVLYFVSTRTRFGRWIYLLGINDRAAHFAGIPVQRVRFILYTLSGFLAGLGAVIMTSWLMAARPDIGRGMELEAITVAVLGGIYIFGGVGNLGGTMLAVLIVTMIANGLQLANINTIWQLAALGFVLLAAVSINQIIIERTGRVRGGQT
jgi:ribose/xylose/arabinose/galactoside ABC-type transport system permease subunit